jgi:hypothetical protein
VGAKRAAVIKHDGADGADGDAAQEGAAMRLPVKLDSSLAQFSR